MRSQVIDAPEAQEIEETGNEFGFTEPADEGEVEPGNQTSGALEQA